MRDASEILAPYIQHQLERQARLAAGCVVLSIDIYFGRRPCMPALRLNPGCRIERRQILFERLSA
jgi:hypothetical protein